MKYLINLSICITLLFQSNNLYSQSLKEVIEFHENGQPNFENVKNLDFKITRVNTYDINGKLIEFTTYNPDTGIKDGEFKQGSNKGFYDNGKLNCQYCTIVTEEGYNSQIVFEGEFKNGKPYGKIKVYSLVEKTRLQSDSYTSYLLSLNMNRRINYSTYVGTGLYDKEKIYDLYFNEKGRLEGDFKISNYTNIIFKNGQIQELYTLNEQNKSIYKDSIGRNFKILKIENRYHKNIGWLDKLSWNDYRGETNVELVYPDIMNESSFNVFFGNEETSYIEGTPLMILNSSGYGKLRPDGLLEKSFFMKIGEDYHGDDINVSDLFFQIPMYVDVFDPFTLNSDIGVYYNLPGFMSNMEENNRTNDVTYGVLEKLKNIANSSEKYGNGNLKETFSTIDFYNVIQDFIDSDESEINEVFLVDINEALYSPKDAKYRSYRDLHKFAIEKDEKRRIEKEKNLVFIKDNFLDYIEKFISGQSGTRSKHDGQDLYHYLKEVKAIKLGSISGSMAVLYGGSSVHYFNPDKNEFLDSNMDFSNIGEQKEYNYFGIVTDEFNSTELGINEIIKEIEQKEIEEKKRIAELKKKLEIEIENADLNFITQKYIDFSGDLVTLKSINSKSYIKQWSANVSGSKYFQTIFFQPTQIYYSSTEYDGNNQEVIADLNKKKGKYFVNGKKQTKLDKVYISTLIKNATLYPEINTNQLTYQGTEEMTIIEPIDNVEDFSTVIEKVYKLIYGNKIMYYSTKDFRKVIEIDNSANESTRTHFYDYKMINNVKTYTKMRIEKENNIMWFELEKFELNPTKPENASL